LVFPKGRRGHTGFVANGSFLKEDPVNPLPDRYRRLQHHTHRRMDGVPGYSVK